MISNWHAYSCVEGMMLIWWWAVNSPPLSPFLLFMCRLWLPSLEPAAIGLWKIFWCQQQHLDAWHSSLNSCLDFYCGQHAAGIFYPAWVIFLFGSPWIIWNLCVSIPWGKHDSLQLLLSICIEGPCSWNIGRILFCFCVCMCFLQEKHTKIYSHPEAIAYLQSSCWDCEYKKRNFCRDGCKFFKICFVSEISNYTSRNFLHCAFFWI